MKISLNHDGHTLTLSVYLFIYLFIYFLASITTCLIVCFAFFIGNPTVYSGEAQPNIGQTVLVIYFIFLVVYCKRLFSDN